MTAVAATFSSASKAVALLLGNAAASTADTDPVPAAVTPDSAATSKDPLDNVDLSDHAKATLSRARTEQVAADNLSAQLQAAKGPATGTPATKAQTVAASYEKITRAFAGLTGLTAADLKPYEPTVPKVTFTSTLQAFGFSISATGNADSWSSDIQVSGPGGVQAWDTIWGGGKGMPTAGGGGASGLKSGQGYMASREDGKVTFTFADAGASATAVATDDAFASTGTASFNATTIVVDFTTGNISAQRTTMSATATMAGTR
ncbi:MAG TPA: hypothetical protein VIQ05_15350 [Tardiphaga sp.]